MADNGIDFGQSSQEKYSLRPFLNKQETPIPIAHDVAQAIQVADNAFKAYKSVDDEANQARYFNATIDLTNLKSQQQDALLNAGNDLNAQRQILDQYKPILEGLSDKYELNDKYRATLGASVESHNSGWEEYYRGKFNAQQKGVAQSNIAVVASTLVGVPKEDAARTLEGLREYYKIMTGEDDRTAGINVFTPYADSKISSVNKDTMTLDQARQLQKDILETGKLADPRITATDAYMVSKEKTDTITEHFRAKEEKVLREVLSLADRKPDEAIKMVNDARKRGVIFTDDEASYLKSKYTEDYIDKQAKVRNREYVASNREISLMSNKLAYDSVTPKEFEATMLEAAKNNKWDERQVMDEIVKYRKPYEQQIMKAQIHDNENKLNDIKSNKKVVKPEELQNIIEGAHASTGVIPSEDRTLMRTNNFEYLHENTNYLMKFDDAIEKGLLLPTDKEHYIKVGNSKVDKLASTAFASKSKRDLESLNLMIESTNQVGSIPNMLAKSFNSAKTDEDSGLRQIEQTVNMADMLISNNPNKASAILGDKTKEYYMYKASMLPDANGSTQITAEEIARIKDVQASKLLRLPAQETSDDNVFKDNYDGTSEKRFVDKETYDALCTMGVGNRQAIKMVNSNNANQKGSNYNVAGIPETDPDRQKLVSAVKSYANDKGQIGGKDSYITVKDNMLLIGTKDRPAMYSSGIPLRTEYDSDGKVSRDENGIPKIGIAELTAMYESDKSRKSLKETMEAPVYKKGLEQFYHKATSKLGLYLDVVELGTYTNVKHNLNTVPEALKWLNENMYVDDTTLKYKLTH